MELTLERFLAIFRKVLSEEVEHLLDFKIALIELAIAQGWRAYHPREIHFMEIFPPPLINNLGRRLEIETMLFRIGRCDWLFEPDYFPAFANQVCSDSDLRSRYRNFMHPGILVGDARTVQPLDLMANTTVARRMECNQEHSGYKCDADQCNWFVEALGRGTLTPPPVILSRPQKSPTRTPGVELEHDGEYWRAVHPSAWYLPQMEPDFWILRRPYWTLYLMDKLAPDFVFDPLISTPRRLLFVRHLAGELAWAVMLDKPAGDSEFRYPPKLILIRRQKKKLKNEHIVFSDVIDSPHYGGVSSPRCIETHLMFHLPRCRRLIAFYTPFVEEALRRTREAERG